MAFSALKSLLLHLLCFFSVGQAKLKLQPQDNEALMMLQRDLGFRGQRLVAPNPCNHAAGISCERRAANNSHVLRVTRVVVESKDLRGTLSPAIRRLTELKELSLANNQLTGQIPPEIVDCRKLEVLNLQNNKFSGEVPSELSLLKRLRVVDLSSNKFAGNLDFLRNFPDLERLSLADNMFTGEVPPSLKSCPKLRFLDISGNSLLEGAVPVISRVDHSSMEFPRRYVLAENSTRGNRSSAIAPNSTAHRPAPYPTSTKKPKKNKSKKRKVRTWIIGFFAGTFAGSLSGLLFAGIFKVLLSYIRGRRKDAGLMIFSPLIKKAEDLAFLGKEDVLASLEIIGKGGCGEVYRAVLPGSDGKVIAIKKVAEPSKDAAELNGEDSKLLNKKMRQIRSEIVIVGQVRHRNLLPLLAHMPQPDCHYLVYEYMKNGSLQDWLCRVSQGKAELDWLSRHRIAMGIAAGLEYLHFNHTQRIIHRDLKPANVLIDDDMEARITDFGLAKAVPDALTHITTSNVAGTVGYIAPEYHQTLKFTEKCDIYSFGIVLGVLVMGKLPSDEFFQHTDEMSLVKWMRNVMTSEDPRRAIDPMMLGNGYEEQMLLVLKIACFCTMDNPKERPNSKDVRAMLSQIKQ